MSIYTYIYIRKPCYRGKAGMIYSILRNSESHWEGPSITMKSQGAEKYSFEGSGERMASRMRVSIKSSGIGHPRAFDNWEAVH